MGAHNSIPLEDGSKEQLTASFQHIDSAHRQELPPSRVQSQTLSRKPHRPPPPPVSTGGISKAATLSRSSSIPPPPPPPPPPPAQSPAIVISPTIKHPAAASQLIVKPTTEEGEKETAPDEFLPTESTNHLPQPCDLNGCAKVQNKDEKPEPQQPREQDALLAEIRERLEGRLQRQGHLSPAPAQVLPPPPTLMKPVPEPLRRTCSQRSIGPTQSEATVFSTLLNRRQASFRHESLSPSAAARLKRQDKSPDSVFSRNSPCLLPYKDVISSTELKLLKHEISAEIRLEVAIARKEILNCLSYELQELRSPTPFEL